MYTQTYEPAIDTAKRLQHLQLIAQDHGHTARINFNDECVVVHVEWVHVSGKEGVDYVQVRTMRELRDALGY